MGALWKSSTGAHCGAEVTGRAVQLELGPAESEGTGGSRVLRSRTSEPISLFGSNVATGHTWIPPWGLAAKNTQPDRAFQPGRERYEVLVSVY